MARVWVAGKTVLPFLHVLYADIRLWMNQILALQLMFESVISY